MKSVVKINDVEENASQRTKNRIQENGTLFILEEDKPNSLLFGGGRALLLRSLRTGWLGWLPTKEIIFNIKP